MAHSDGTVVISVTDTQDDARPVRWNKAKEILGTDAGLNPNQQLWTSATCLHEATVLSNRTISRKDTSDQ
jgi:hypothetical protein